MMMMMGTLRLIGHGKKIGFPDVGFRGSTNLPRARPWPWPRPRSRSQASALVKNIARPQLFRGLLSAWPQLCSKLALLQSLPSSICRWRNVELLKQKTIFCKVVGLYYKGAAVALLLWWCYLKRVKQTLVHWLVSFKRKELVKYRQLWGWHSTELAFALPTQLPQAWSSEFLKNFRF